VSALTGFDQVFESIGTKALQVIFILSVFLTIVVGALVAGGTEEAYVYSFVSGLSNALNVKWMYEGIKDLGEGAKTVSSSIASVDIVNMFRGLTTATLGLVKIVANMIGVILSGYVTVSIFVIDSLPGLIRPIGVFISLGLIFVQLCCLWTVTKYLFNLARSLISMITGGAYTPF